MATAPASAVAQEVTALPAYQPINPMAQARSGLFSPAPSAPGSGWRWTAGFDYASLIEYNIAAYDMDSYVLDAEISRLTLSLGRDLSPRYFIEAATSLSNAESGFMDGFINWYHGLLGLDIPERELRPLDEFAYRVDLPDGSTLVRDPGSTVGDIRLSLGRRHTDRLQTLVSATVATGPARSGYNRGTSSLSAITTFLAPLSGRLSYQGSLGLGYTPAHGDLARYQREVFGSFASGVGYRIWGHQSLYAQLYYHTPSYMSTGYRALDRAEVSLRYGWMLRAAGRTWMIGMTEDLVPGGPAIDAVFEFGLSWD